MLSLRAMFLRCDITVCVDKCNTSAISLLLRPLTICMSTSFSRLDNSSLLSSRLKECINGNDGGSGKWWKGDFADLKMYDPKVNLHHKVEKKQRMGIRSCQDRF